MEKKLETHTFIFAIVVGNLGFVTKWTRNPRPITIQPIVIVIGNSWVATTRNWRLAIWWTWNLGHVAIWNIVVVEYLWLVVGWVGNLGLIF